MSDFSPGSPRPSPNSATCWDVVHRAAAGDGEARARFGHTYMPLIRAILSARWPDRSRAADVDDASQDVFLECFRPDGPLSRADEARGDFRGFLFGIVRNVALRVEARRRADAADASGLDELASEDDPLSRIFDREWARLVMREAGSLMQARAAVSGAGARMRVEILRLRFADDLPLREIAAQWEMDPDAIHRAYAKARDEFRNCLREVVSAQEIRTEEGLDAECQKLIDLLG